MDVDGDDTRAREVDFNRALHSFQLSELTNLRRHELLQVVRLADHSEHWRVGATQLVFNIWVQTLGGEVELDTVKERDGLVQNVQLVFRRRRSHEGAGDEANDASGQIFVHLQLEGELASIVERVLDDFSHSAAGSSAHSNLQEVVGIKCLFWDLLGE